MKVLTATVFLLTTMPICSAQSTIQGLGKSTVTCVDKDGDGYGTGEGCLGPDADDNDPTVQTAAQAIAAYGGIHETYQRRGYNPTRYWLIDPVNGNNSKGTPYTPAAFDVCTAAGNCAAYLDNSTILGSIAPGDAVVIRAGTLTTWRFYPLIQGTTNTPVYYLTYPGETVTLSGTSAKWTMMDKSWFVLDGFKTINNACWDTIGTNDQGTTVTASTSHDITIRRIEGSNCGVGLWGMVGLVNILVEESSFHNNTTSHGLYFGTRGTIVSDNVTVRRSLFYNNNYTGLQYNGRFQNSEISQNIVYLNGISGISLENGTNNSRIYSNLIFDNSNKQMNMATYDGNEGTSSCGVNHNEVCTCDPPNQAAICAWSVHDNAVANNTFYSSGYGQNGTVNANPLIWIGRMSTGPTGCNTAHCLATYQYNNTFQNNLLVQATAASSHNPPLIYTNAETSALPTGSFTSTVNGLMYYEAAHNYTAWLGWGSYSGGGYNAYNCSTATGYVLSEGNCQNANPQFSALGAWNTPAAYNFSLQAGSPAIHTGTSYATLATPPVYDLTGNIYASTPSMGAQETSGSGALTSLACTPTTVTAGASVSCTVSLLQAAGSGGAVVALSSSSGAITLPANVTVTAGANTGTFTATVGSGSPSQTVAVTAGFNGSTQTALLTFAAAPATLTSVTCSPATIVSGSTATCTVALSASASAIVTVSLASSTPLLTVPASVSVPAGAGSAQFTASAAAISVTQNGTITATYGTASATASVSLQTAAASALSSITCSPTSIVSGGTATCTITLSTATPAAAAISLASSTPLLTVPASASVPAGAGTAQVTATGGTISSGQTGTITATYGTASASATISLQPAPAGGTGGVTISPGSWTMVPTHGVPVQTVGYEKLIYAPAPFKKMVMLGNYHEMGSEPNTALIAYDFPSNQWSVLDVTGLFHTENMPEAGHSVGAFAYSPNLNTFIYYCCASGSNQPEDPLLTWWYDPIGQTGRNKQTAVKPGNILLESSAFDSINNTYVIQGGSSFEGTWTYNPSTNVYQQQTPAGTPPNPSVLMPGMTFNTTDHQIYLFGGQIGSAYSNDLFTYNVATNTWTKVNPSGARPAPRWECGFAFDSVNNVFLLYGGRDASTIYNDTWSYDPRANAWTQLTPAQNPPTPPTVAFERLAYDPDDNVFVLVLAGPGGFLDGTWSGYPVQTWMFRYSGAGPNPGTISQSYIPTANSINHNSSAWAKDPSLAASGGTLVTAWVETGSPFQTGAGTWFHVYSAQQTGSGWTALGGLPASLDSEFANVSESHAPSIAVVAGTPWISWYKGNNSGATPVLYAKSWNGSTWTGGAIGIVGTDPTRCFQGPSQIVDVAGVPHVAFLEVDKTYYPQKTFVYVKYWNGTAWVLKGTGPLNINVGANTIAGSVSIASDGSNPYVAWTEYTSANAAVQSQTNPLVYVARWTGTQWVSVGGALNVTASSWADSAAIAFAGGQPYVAWTERTAAGNAQLFVKTFNGTSWVSVGSGSLNKDTNTGWAFHPSLAVDPVSGNLYLGWVEQQAIGQPSQAYVSVLTNGVWSALGGALNADPSGSVQRLSVAVAGGLPAAAWGEVKFGSLRQVFVKQWNGTSWAAASGGTRSPSACDLNGDGFVNAVDVQLATNQVLGTASCTNADLLHTGTCNVVDVQRVINAATGGACVTGP